jgi:hypothetical protein
MAKLADLLAAFLLEEKKPVIGTTDALAATG